MTNASTIVGRAVAGLIVTGPVPMLNVIRSAPAVAFASPIAARSVQFPSVSWQRPSPRLAYRCLRCC